MTDPAGDGLRIRVRARGTASEDFVPPAGSASAGSPRPTEDSAQQPLDAAHGVRVSARVREALVCPYCRDQVARDDVVACAARTCGALYHRECWEHCATEFGSCAALGCGSTQHRELSAVGYLYRLARLFVAAILFPPRALKAWRETPRDSSVYQEAHRRAGQGLDQFLSHPLLRFLVFVCLVVLSYSVALGILFGVASLQGGSGILQSQIAIFCVMFCSPLLVPVLSYLATFQLVLGFHLARATLAGEFAALDRADQGGLSYLARIAASVGKGKS